MPNKLKKGAKKRSLDKELGGDDSDPVRINNPTFGDEDDEDDDDKELNGKKQGARGAKLDPNSKSRGHGSKQFERLNSLDQEDLQKAAGARRKNLSASAQNSEKQFIKERYALHAAERKGGVEGGGKQDTASKCAQCTIQ